MLGEIADEILKSKELDRTIFTVGNGGSAATASHMINDLMKGCRIGKRIGFRALCLNDPNAVITCLANDFSYEDVYQILLSTIARRGDLLIAFSGSGNSPNILRVCEEARNMGITVIGFSGHDGGKLKPLCDYCILAPTFSMEQIEDLHMFYVHSLICHLRKRLEMVWDIEVINYPKKKACIAIFDFDGTVSLLRDRYNQLKAGADPTRFLVPGVKETLNALKDLNVKCYLTSETDEVNVIEEVGLLGLADLFESIHGATDENSNECSKERVLQELIKNELLDGSDLILFGDGYVEIEFAKQIGAYAVAVASNEERMDSSINEQKRLRLLSAGADCVIPDFSNTKKLINFIYGL